MQEIIAMGNPCIRSSQADHTVTRDKVDGVASDELTGGSGTASERHGDWVWHSKAYL